MTAKQITTETEAVNTQSGEVTVLASIDDESKRLNGKQLNQLMTGLRPDRVSTRKQGGATLSYVEAWDIKRTLIRIFGFGNFSADVTESQVLKMIEEDRPMMNWKDGKPSGPKMVNGVQEVKKYFTVLAKCTVRLEIHATGATYTESAAASQTGPDIGEVTDFAIKTAESDALKRAAIYLGSQFGLSLYDNGSMSDVVLAILDEDQSVELSMWRQAMAAKHAEQQRAAAQQANAPQDGSTPTNAAPNPAQGNTAPPAQTVAGAFAHPGDAGAQA